MKKTKLDSKWLWAKNCLIKFASRNNRDKKIWVYGSWLGDKYSDNSKYFFEYMNEVNKDIRSIWISKNEEVVKEVKNKGYEAYNSNTIEGKQIMKKAGVSIFTNSIMDLGDIDYCTGSYKVALWHGMPLKRIYLADNRKKNCNKLKLKCKEVKRTLYSDVDRDLSIATSKLTKLHVATTFGLDSKNVIISGQPRNDIFLKDINLKIRDVIKQDISYEIEEKKSKIICYMPTYRSYKENAVNLETTINEIVYSKKLEKILEDTNTYLIIKGHYLVEKNSEKNKRIIFVNDKDISCTQELLLISDVLITDYSSVFIDYLILERPILFLTTDYEKYNKYENGLNEDYKSLLEIKPSKNIDELTTQLDELNLNYKKYKKESRRLNEIFNDVKIDKNSYSDNVYNEIKKRIEKREV